MNGSVTKALFFVLLVTGIFLVGYLLLNPGYGTVSRQAYDFSKAIYGACLAKSEQRLETIDKMLEASVADGLPSHEHAWLKAMINTARTKDWEAAAKKAKDMMKHQARSSTQPSPRRM